MADPSLVSAIADRFGRQCCVVAVDARREGDRWQVLTHAGTRVARPDAVAWAREGVEQGAGEILLTSMDRDGTKDGFDIALTRAVADAVNVPVVASGGAGTVAHMAEALTEGRASAALAAVTVAVRLPRPRPSNVLSLTVPLTATVRDRVCAASAVAPASSASCSP